MVFTMLFPNFPYFPSSFRFFRILKMFVSTPAFTPASFSVPVLVSPFPVLFSPIPSSSVTPVPVKAMPTRRRKERKHRGRKGKKELPANYRHYSTPAGIHKSWKWTKRHIRDTVDLFVLTCIAWKTRNFNVKSASLQYSLFVIQKWQMEPPNLSAGGILCGRCNTNLGRLGDNCQEILNMCTKYMNFDEADPYAFQGRPVEVCRARGTSGTNNYTNALRNGKPVAANASYTTRHGVDLASSKGTRHCSKCGEAGHNCNSAQCPMMTMWSHCVKARYVILLKEQ